MKLAHAIERFRRRQRLRYWALGLPLLIIAMALPLLRPLRHPDPSAMADDEFVRLQAIRAIAFYGRFSLDPATVEDRVTVLYVPSGDSWLVLPAQEPMLSVLGAGVFQLLRVSGVTAAPDEVLGTYLLTLILSTLPCAIAAVLLYRCARVLELGRGKRMFLALAAIVCGGLIPFATVLSPYALAAMLVIASLACMVHVATSLAAPAGLPAGWFVLGGFFAGLGAAVHPSVAALGVCLMLSIFGMPFRRRLRLFGVLLFALGALAPVASHRLLLIPYGDVWTVEMPIIDPAPGGTAIARPLDDEPPEPESAVGHVLWSLGRAIRVLFGPFGVLSHSPAVLIGVAGVLLLLMRHWPRSTRTLAAATLLSVLVTGAVWMFGPLRGGERMYGPQPLVTTLPVLILFAGVFLRSSRLGSMSLSVHLVGWTLVFISFCIGLLGMLRPYPRGGFPTYAPYVLLRDTVLNPTAERRTNTDPAESPSPTTKPASDDAGGP